MRVTPPGRDALLALGAAGGVLPWARFLGHMALTDRGALIVAKRLLNAGIVERCGRELGEVRLVPLDTGDDGAHNMFTEHGGRTVDQNLNLSECIQSANYVGYTHYQNVCSGAHSDVVWGTLDWMGFVLLVTPMAVAAVIIAAVIIAATFGSAFMEDC